MRIDLHTHTKYSFDGGLEPKYIVKLCMKKGLSGIAITDHNTIRGAVETKKYETKDFTVIVGAEIMTERGELIGLFLESEIRSRRVEEVVAEIKSQNGIVVVPHPFDALRKSSFFPTANEVKYIDFVECYNARCVLHRYNQLAENFARRYQLPIVAGSDAHFESELGLAGIEFDTADADAVATEEQLRAILETGKFGIFGRKTFIGNHFRSKIVKWYKKLGF